MKTKLLFVTMLMALLISCSSSKVSQGFPNDPLYESLKIGQSKPDIIAILGKDYKFDMNTVTQTANNYVETLIWNAPTPGVAYTLTFVNNKLSKKSRENVIQTEGGGNIQINR